MHKTGNMPLSMSVINTIAANFLPAMRSTLVVPGFLDPCRRGSGKSNKRHTMIAEQIEPVRYARLMLNIAKNALSINTPRIEFKCIMS